MWDKHKEGKEGKEGKRVAGSRTEKKTKKPSRLTRQQKVLIAVAVVLAIALAAVVACQRLFVEPELISREEDPGKEAIDYGEGTQPRADGQRKSDNWYTVLILGRDTGGGGNTDTILLASYDVTNQKATVMSIPRDTMVNVSWDIKRINSVYNMNGQGEKGITALYKEIAQLVGFEPDFQVVVEWDAVGEIVDAMGGVYFDVPRNMNYDDPYQDLHIHQEKGYRLLTGDDAMQVIRYRHDNNMSYGYPDGDLGRIKTQQAFLKAVVEQLLQVKNFAKIKQFAKVFQNNVETDLSFSNICWFGQQAVLGGLKVEDVTFVTMPNTPVPCWSRTYQNMQSYVVPNARELLELVNNELSPFVEAFTFSDLDIMSVNANGSVSSTTGHVEDSRAAQPPVKPAKAPEEPTEYDEELLVDESGNVLDPETGEIIVVGPDTEPDTGSQGSDTPQTTPTPPAETTPSTPTAPPAETEPPVSQPEPEPAPETPAEPSAPAEPTPEEPGFAIIDPAPEG